MCAQQTPIINAFTAGELSPHLEGRTDFEKYYSGCRRLENFILRPHGSVYRRSGTRFIGQPKYPDQPTRILSFDFNSTTSQSYVIEMGHLYFRFYKNDGLILDRNNNPYEIETPYTKDMLATINTVQSCDTVFFVHPHVQPMKLTRFWHDKWDLSPITFQWPGYDLEIAHSKNTPAGKDGDYFGLPAGRYFEQGMIIKQYKENTWFKYKGYGVYVAEKYDLGVLMNDEPLYSLNRIESIFLKDGTFNEKHWEYHSRLFTMPTAWEEGNWPGVVGFYEDRLVFGSTKKEPLSLWMSRTGEYEDFRLNTAGEVDGVQEDPLDDDAIFLTLSGARINPICWIMDQQELLVGTNAGELRVWSGFTGEGMTPAKVQRKRQSAHGSSNFPAQLVDSAVLFITRSGRKLRRMAFDYTSDKYVSPEITLLAGHVTGDGIMDMEYAREPDGIIWAVRKDGVLAACTYLPDQNVIAWHRHILGGNGACESICCTPGEKGDDVWLVVRRTINGRIRRYIERLEPVFEAKENNATDAFFVDCGLSSGWEITIVSQHTTPLLFTVPGHELQNGDIIRLEQVPGEEKLNNTTWTVTGVDGNRFSLTGDTGPLTTEQAPTWVSGGRVYRYDSVLTNLGHLEGEEVDILIDGSVHPPQKVKNSRVILNYPGWKVHAGFQYKSLLQPMRLEVGSQNGTAQTKRKRIMGVNLRLQHTLGGKVCVGDDRKDRYERLPGHKAPVTAGTPPKLVNTDVDITLAGGFEREGLFTVCQDDPLPMTLVCCVPRVHGSE